MVDDAVVANRDVRWLIVCTIVPIAVSVALAAHTSTYSPHVFVFVVGLLFAHRYSLMSYEGTVLAFLALQGLFRAASILLVPPAVSLGVFEFVAQDLFPVHVLSALGISASVRRMQAAGFMVGIAVGIAVVRAYRRNGRHDRRLLFAACNWALMWLIVVPSAFGYVHGSAVAASVSTIITYDWVFGGVPLGFATVWLWAAIKGRVTAPAAEPAPAHVPGALLPGPAPAPVFGAPWAAMPLPMEAPLQWAAPALPPGPARDLVYALPFLEAVHVEPAELPPGVVPIGPMRQPDDAPPGVSEHDEAYVPDACEPGPDYSSSGGESQSESEP